MVDAGLDVNLSGKAGMTLLHWAFFDDNLDAFKLLLELGADPDKHLAEPIKVCDGWMVGGESILFTCMRSRQMKKWAFFCAALAHTRDVNQRDFFGETLLLASMDSQVFASMTEEVLQRILASGVELDAGRKWQYGNIACDGVGSAAVLPSDVGGGGGSGCPERRRQTVADILSSRLELFELRGVSYYRPGDAERLKDWLEPIANRRWNSGVDTVRYHEVLDSSMLALVGSSLCQFRAFRRTWTRADPAS